MYNTRLKYERKISRGASDVICSKDLIGDERDIKDVLFEKLSLMSLMHPAVHCLPVTWKDTIMPDFGMLEGRGTDIDIDMTNRHRHDAHVKNLIGPFPMLTIRC